MLRNFTYLLSFSLLLLSVVPATGQFGEREGIISNIPDEIYEASVDLNQDGLQDIIVFRPAGSIISGGHYVKYNDGTGQFTNEQLLKNDNAEWTRITPADLDGDGRLDLAIYQLENRKVVWLMNRGLGQEFSWQFNIITDIIDGYNDNKSSFIFKDIDGDDDLDFLCGCSKSWYKNNGQGEFTESFEINNRIFQVLFATDLDQDGAINVATYNISTNSIMSYEYRADDSWVEETLVGNEDVYPFDTERRAEPFDMDNDGDIDIAYYGIELFRRGNISIFRNDNGSYLPFSVDNYEEEGDPVNFTIIDYDNNGFLDIVSGSKFTDPNEDASFSGNDKIFWFKNESGSFSYEIIAEQYYMLDVGRYNQDNQYDFAAWRPKGVDLLLGNSDNFTFQNLVARTGVSPNGEIRTADLNGDNLADFLLVSSNISSIAFPSDVTNGFSAITVVLSQPASDYQVQVLNDVSSIIPESLRFADLDNDGDLDAVASLYTRIRAFDPDEEEWEIIWYENLGSGTFGERKPVGSGKGVFNKELKIFDSDQDGYPEVAAFNAVFKNNNGSFEQSATIPIPLSVADLNGDGATDIIAEGNWYENDGSGDYTIRTEVEGTPVDFDGDGDIDLVLDERFIVGDASWYENDGSGTFNVKTFSEVTEQNEPREYVDIDTDGDADVIIEGRNALSWKENTDGQGTFENNSVIVNEGIFRFQLNDTDGDSDPDLYVSLNGLTKFENLFAKEAPTDLSLALENQDGLQQDTIKIPLKIEGGFSNITALSLSLTWDNSVATYAEVESSENLTIEASQTEDGRVGITWNDPSGASKTDGSTLLSLRLVLTGDEQSNTAISFSSEPVEQTATNTEEQAISLTTEDAQVVINPSEAPTNINLVDNIISENQAIGTEVGKFNTTDPDNSEGFVYDLVAGDGDTDNSSFSIQDNALITSEIFDFENRDTYSIRVRTTDIRGKSYEENFEIEIEDVDDTNNNPTTIILSSNTINENNEVLATVGELSTQDPDEDDTHTFKLVTGSGDEDNESFTVDGNNLLATETFDFEQKDNYSIRVEVEDNQGGTYSETLSITINDLDESTNNAPTAIAIDKASVEENQPATTIVGNFTTTDADAADRHTYSLVEGEGSAGNNLFQIIGNQLQTTESLDYEEQKTYSVRVQTDDGKGGQFASTFTIEVINLSDNPNQSPTDITLDNNTIDENVPAGTLVGLLTTDDPDNLTFTYQLVSGTGSTHNNSFNIQENELRSAMSFDYETLSQLSIRIQSDDGRGGAVSKVFTVLVNNVEDQINRAPTNIVISNASIEEDQPAGTLVGTLSTIDPDIDDEHQYELLDRNGQVPFSIEENKLLSTTSLDVATQDRYLVEIQADDGRGGLYVKTLAISVTPANAVDVLGVINPIGDQQAATNEAFTLVIPNDVFRGDDLQITVTQADDSSLPEWLTFNAETNTLSGMPPNASGTTLTIKITATNAAGDSVSDEFVLSVEGVTAIGDDISTQWNVYPIPAHHAIFIESNATVAQLQSYRVINVQGKTVLAKRFSQNLSEKIRIDVSALTEGIYLLELQTGQKLYQTRLLIK
ncbi:MAG: FG-GAP-like repeat-containing protein [Tunicatimonas sp.]|uniref:FG-GAP-like repeat-containing protein n=1 Tax=Tunicatimonas sp. TaxID=1940096 RepID=UPI003C73474D